MPDIDARPLSPELYAPYGAVIASREHGSRPCNHDTGEAWDELATLVNVRGSSAQASAALFRQAPQHLSTLQVRWLERHPGSTQLFVPMNEGRFLVVVALGGDTPDLSTLAAFVGGARQAITYAPGVWHHPMIALDREIDFVNLLYVDGTAGDCDERSFDPPCATVVVPT